MQTNIILAYIRSVKQK